MGEKKKINTIVFMIGATLFNIVLIVGFFLLLMILLSLLMKVVNISENLFSILSVVVIILSFVLSFIVYRKVMMIVNEKWDIGSKGSMRRE